MPDNPEINSAAGRTPRPSGSGSAPPARRPDGAPPGQAPAGQASAGAPGPSAPAAAEKPSRKLGVAGASESPKSRGPSWFSRTAVAVSLLLTLILQVALVGLVAYMFVFVARASARLDQPAPPTQMNVNVAPLYEALKEHTTSEVQKIKTDTEQTLEEVKKTAASSAGLQKKVKTLETSFTSLQEQHNTLPTRWKEDIQQSLQNAPPPGPPAARNVIDQDTLVLALHSGNLPQEPLLEAVYPEVFARQDLRGVQGQHRVAFVIATTAHITPVFGAGQAPEAQVIRRTALPATVGTSENLADVGEKRLAEQFAALFGERAASRLRRCVIVASTRCRAPLDDQGQPHPAWKDVDVDALLIAPDARPPDPATLADWQQFCGVRRGSVAVLRGAPMNEDRFVKAAQFHLHRLTEPLDSLSP